MVWKKPDLQRAVTEANSIKFIKYKVKGDLGFGYTYQYKDSLSSISALCNLVVIIRNHCLASTNTLLKWCRESCVDLVLWERLILSVFVRKFVGTLGNRRDIILTSETSQMFFKGVQR